MLLFAKYTPTAEYISGVYIMQPEFIKHRPIIPAMSYLQRYPSVI